MSIKDDLEKIEADLGVENQYSEKVMQVLEAMYPGMKLGLCSNNIILHMEPLCYLFETDLNLSFMALYEKIRSYSHSEINEWLSSVGYPAISHKIIRKPKKNFAEFLEFQKTRGRK